MSTEAREYDNGYWVRQSSRRKRFHWNSGTVLLVVAAFAGGALGTAFVTAPPLLTGSPSASTSYDCGFVSPSGVNAVPAGGGVPPGTVYFADRWGLSKLYNSTISPVPSLTVSSTYGYGTGIGGYEYLVDELAFGCEGTVPSGTGILLELGGTVATAGSMDYAVIFIQNDDVNAGVNPGGNAPCDSNGLLSEPTINNTHGGHYTWTFNQASSTSPSVSPGFITGCDSSFGAPSYVNANNTGFVFLGPFSNCWTNDVSGGDTNFHICAHISFAIIGLSASSPSQMPAWTLGYTTRCGAC